MKFLDDKGRILGKFSIVDLLVIVLLIGCVAAVGLKFKTSQSIRGGDCVIEYKIRVENIREFSVNAMRQTGKDVIDAETKHDIGEIVDVAPQKARVLVQTNDGDFKLSEYDNYFDTVISMRTTGTETDDGYFASSGRQLSVGDTIGVNNGYAQFFGEIISVEVAQ